MRGDVFKINSINKVIALIMAITGVYSFGFAAVVAKHCQTQSPVWALVIFGVLLIFVGLGLVTDKHQTH